jgi:nitrogen fixation protein NifB
MPQMRHCTRCRADAVGLLGEATGPEAIALLQECARLPIVPSEDRPYVAVGSMEGMLVNQHLGEAMGLWVFGRQSGGYRIVERRRTPPAGGGHARWADLANILQDCRALLVSGAGESPRSVLREHGIQVVEMEGLIEPALRAIYGGEEIRLPQRQAKTCCGSDCAGDGQGCG